MRVWRYFSDTYCSRNYPVFFIKSLGSESGSTLIKELLEYRVTVAYPGGMHRMHVHPPSPPCASPHPAMCIPPPPAWKAGYEKRWGSGQQEKNGSLFTCDLIIFCRVSTSVVDPYSFFPGPDPDPEFAVGDQYGSGFRIRIQYGSRALMTKSWKKITAEKKRKFFFDQKLQFTYP